MRSRASARGFDRGGAGSSRTAAAANRILDNGGLGIDLGGDDVTENDVDEDRGANELQNFPELTDVRTVPEGIQVVGVLDVSPISGTASYAIGFYKNVSCDPSGHGEGEVFLGSSFVLLSDSSEGFSFTLPADVDAGSEITATATSIGSGNTSELSACVSLAPACGDANESRSLTATDALTALRAAVGTADCPVCVCDVNASGSVTSSDALLILKSAVGQSVIVSCTACI